MIISLHMGEKSTIDIREEFRAYAEQVALQFKGNDPAGVVRLEWAANHSEEVLNSLECMRWQEENGDVHRLSFEASGMCFPLVVSFLSKRGETRDYKTRGWEDAMMGRYVLRSAVQNPEYFIEDMTGLLPQTTEQYHRTPKRQLRRVRFERIG